MSLHHPHQQQISATKLLAHITFFDRSNAQIFEQLRRLQRTGAVRDFSAGADEHTGWPVPHNETLLKTGRVWREHVFECLLASLLEFDRRYSELFSRVDVVVDCNTKNGFLDQLRTFGQRNLTFVNLEVRVHAVDVPRLAFRLAWMHREHMERALEQYDWFLYAEVGVRTCVHAHLIPSI